MGSIAEGMGNPAAPKTLRAGLLAATALAASIYGANRTEAQTMPEPTITDANRSDPFVFTAECGVAPSTTGDFTVTYNGPVADGERRIRVTIGDMFTDTTVSNGSPKTISVENGLNAIVNLLDNPQPLGVIDFAPCVEEPVPTTTTIVVPPSTTTTTVRPATTTTTEQQPTTTTIVIPPSTTSTTRVIPPSTTSTTEQQPTTTTIVVPPSTTTTTRVIPPSTTTTTEQQPTTTVKPATPTTIKSFIAPITSPTSVVRPKITNKPTSHTHNKVKNSTNTKELARTGAGDTLPLGIITGSGISLVALGFGVLKLRKKVQI